MARTNHRKEMLEVAIALIAKSGFEDFTLKTVANQIGVAETLVYKYFPNKRSMIDSCIQEVLQNSSAWIASQGPRPDPKTPEEAIAYAKNCWYSYLNYLVQERDRTVFYLRCTEYGYVTSGVSVLNGKFPAFSWMFERIKFLLPEMAEVADAIVAPYILSNTITFSRKLMSGELPDTSSNRAMICQLIFHGVSSFVSVDLEKEI